MSKETWLQENVACSQVLHQEPCLLACWCLLVVVEAELKLECMIVLNDGVDTFWVRCARRCRWRVRLRWSVALCRRCRSNYSYYYIL